MIVVAKPVRRVLAPGSESQELKELRQRTRRVLGRPFKFEPTAVTPLWQIVNPDPLVSLFKPFSPVTAIAATPVVRDLRSELRDFSWRRVALPITLGAFLVAVFTVWQVLTIVGRYPAGLGQGAPKFGQTSPSSLGMIPNGLIVPAGTRLGTTTPTGSNQTVTSPQTSLSTSGGSSSPPPGQTNLTSSTVLIH